MGQGIRNPEVSSDPEVFRNKCQTVDNIEVWIKKRFLIDNWLSYKSKEIDLTEHLKPDSACSR